MAPLSLAADQNFSGAGSVPHAQGQARSLRSVCYSLNRRASLPPFDQARVAVLRSVRSPGGRGRQRSTRLILYVRASSVQSFKSCHSASTFTRAPGKPQVRQGFWLLAPGPPKSSGSSSHDTAISSGRSALLRRQLHSGGAPFLRIIARPRRSIRAHGLRVRHLGFPSHAPRSTAI
ncbi:hypothetical protein NDU88_001459 [Pleurodeles waltl]|uniref:Uncharacterized protein n=1 Tax=Pleurodeles waltl TaxID=8319 RepID=A0AAV7TID2_PLEWA|nr:hypothetical protein NDU88_001459 [Pleurodeles waltl]